MSFQEEDEEAEGISGAPINFKSLFAFPVPGTRSKVPAFN